MGKLSLSLLGAFLLAQTDLDAERWSQAIPQGSTRALGMAGAFTALGGDPANLTQNPAGLGLFLRGGLWLSPTLTISTTSTSYINAVIDSRSRLGIGNFAVIFHGDGNKSITQWSLGFGFNQEGLYHQQSRAVGFNQRNSFTQAIAEMAEGVPDTLLAFTPALAYQNFFDLGAPLGTRGVIDAVNVNPFRYKGVFSEGGVYQEITAQELGRMNTWAIGAGLCYQNIVFFGASLLIRDLRYSNLYRLREIDTDNRYDGTNSTTPADEVSFREKYSTSGTGIGLAVGVLVEPTDFLRLGLSMTTGSRMRLTDEYNAEMNFVLDDGRQNRTTYLEPFQYEYRFVYPYRVSGGVALLLAKKGAITLEGDFLDYRTVSFSPAGQNVYSYDQENEIIEKEFGTAFNIRSGIEWMITPNVGLRGGYAYYSPVRNAEGQLYYADYTRPQELKRLAMERQFICLGGSYIMEKFFIDFAYMYGMGARKYPPYSVRNPTYGPAPIVVIQSRTHMIFTTLGLRF
ncbi:MAG: hypothetical protein RMJ66_00875 [Bacteroidia bacterium]|nr:outer membrane protein transport protein [Bacteroidia bacterium]MDW8133598.1 hypothetical protein [Bacteroidia bacterium]